jgi:leucyl-tRNA synthetase
MELVNGLNKFLDKEVVEEESLRVLKGAVEHLIILVSPFCPHITQELWEALGHQELLINKPWPSYIEEYVREETVTVAIQVSGKLRDTVEVERDLPEDALRNLILSLEKVQRHLGDRPVRKFIVVPNKLVNIVV